MLNICGGYTEKIVVPVCGHSAASFSPDTENAMFWSEPAGGGPAFKPISLNASVVKFLLEDVEGGTCNEARVERICQAIETEINRKLNDLQLVPDLTDLFLRHYESPEGATFKRSPVTEFVSER